MRNILLLIFILSVSCSLPEKETRAIPGFLLGNFEDDYKVQYSISDSLFVMESHTKIHILEWNTEQQFFVGQNDSLNTYDPLLFSRIDWMKFENMGEFEWGFCMSAYNEVNLDSALSVDSADRNSPKTGCNGYPFSRMKRIANEG